MNKAPVLVLQMQRMGDLVLSFPLLAKLREAYPDHPLWVVGEQAFFKPLLSLSPQATYFSYANAPDPRAHVFAAVINLSFRPEAAALAGKAKTEHLIGPWLDEQGQMFIRGEWQLYRASLTYNNRYNLYHWADLNTLDALPHSLALRRDWMLPRPLPQLGSASGGRASGVRIGLFLGASEPEKHPDAPFWAGLAKILLKIGHKPVLLGGEAEKALGRATAHLLGAPHLDLTGRFSVAALAQFIHELDLLITPDTGPMHIASGLGTPVLNLSMGPVNPWETGPASPGHHVLRPDLDCTGCWRCTQENPLCRDQFTHAKAASVAAFLFSPQDPQGHISMLRRTHGLELLRTDRDEYGLYCLQSLTGARASANPETLARPALSRFWQAWFGALFNLFPREALEQAWLSLRASHPQAAEKLAEAAADLALKLARAFRANPGHILSTPQFWEQADPLVRPLSGYIQMYAQNEQGSRQAFVHILSLAEQVAELV
ncbi:MAG: glycosyltransferase family 9 protein [Desulfovibrionaceae bacterium]|nr:glycosyltransferase family 9 protein [Desulfovibrionaceae bacterium]